MVEYMVGHPGGETLSGLRSIAINVLGKAGYGHGQAWSPDFAKSLDNNNGDANASGKDWSEGDGRVAYFKTIALVTSMFIQAVLVPNSLKRLFFMPKPFQFLGRQMENVPRYIKEISEAETQRETTKTTTATASRNSHNMLDMLLKYSNMGSNPSGLFLTDDEVSGNLWIFTAAGFDTTANTMGFAVILLTAYPEHQEWVREELCRLDADMSQWEYEDVFSRCPRLLAVMYETMRLYTPTLHTHRSANGMQQVADADGTHLLAGSLDIYVSQQTMHSDTANWGADAGEFKPKRWLEKDSESSSEQLIDISNLRSFLPWGSGPRICPGMKMAQVEFVASLATLFRHARCEPLPVPGVTEPEALRRRLVRIMDESVSQFSLQVKDPAQVQLRWVRDEP